MKRWLNDLDQILRGETTRVGSLRKAEFQLPLGGLLLLVLLMSIWYGACMGIFAGFRGEGSCLMQWLACSVKVPALLFLTLAVTSPSLYVFNALVGSRLTFAALSQLVVASLAVTVAVLASLGPIVAFFSVSTTSHPFVLLLNSLVFVVSGCLGFAFMMQTLCRWAAAQQLPLPQKSESRDGNLSEGETPQAENEEPVVAQLIGETGALWGVRGHVLDRPVKRLLICWMWTCGLVCAQMAWVLRPFFDPSEPFRWFCPRESNFLEALWNALCALL